MQNPKRIETTGHSLNIVLWCVLLASAVLCVYAFGEWQRALSADEAVKAGKR